MAGYRTPLHIIVEDGRIFLAHAGSDCDEDPFSGPLNQRIQH
jgi:hypothetical protein